MFFCIFLPALVLSSEHLSLRTKTQKNEYKISQNALNLEERVLHSVGDALLINDYVDKKSVKSPHYTTRSQLTVFDPLTSQSYSLMDNLNIVGKSCIIQGTQKILLNACQSNKILTMLIDFETMPPSAIPLKDDKGYSFLHMIATRTHLATLSHAHIVLWSLDLDSLQMKIILEIMVSPSKKVDFGLSEQLFVYHKDQKLRILELDKPRVFKPYFDKTGIKVGDLKSLLVRRDVVTLLGYDETVVIYRRTGSRFQETFLKFNVSSLMSWHKKIFHGLDSSGKALVFIYNNGFIGVHDLENGYLYYQHLTKHKIIKVLRNLDEGLSLVIQKPSNPGQSLSDEVHLKTFRLLIGVKTAKSQTDLLSLLPLFPEVLIRVIYEYINDYDKETTLKLIKT